MLVLVALTIFGLFALAAAVVELGAAGAAQAELQDAVDLAAREGLRGRDRGLDDAERVRRESARDAVLRSFDADLDLSTPNAGLALGAGGIVQTQALAGIGGAGGFDPAQISRYIPELELNRLNAPHGDLVAGAFRAEQPAFETATYERTDFEPASPDAAGSANAFLVRARRTRDAQGLDAVPDVSSSGPPLPLLFGLGASLQPVNGSGEVYDPRRDGLTVRATAIADARPALAACLGPDGSGLLEFGPSATGAGVWALDVAFWNAGSPGDMLLLEAAAGRVVELGGGAAVGAIVPVAGRLAVGNPLSPALAGGPPAPDDAQASVGPRTLALVQAEGPGLVRVVAFGALLVTNTEADLATGTLRLEAQRLGITVASERATAHAPDAWLALEEAGPASVPGLRALFDAVTDRLLVPVLVR